MYFVVRIWRDLLQSRGNKAKVTQKRKEKVYRATFRLIYAVGEFAFGSVGNSLHKCVH